MINAHTLSQNMNHSGIQHVAVVTGAAGGIGASIIRKLASEGSIVAAIDQNAQALHQLVNQLSAEGMQVHAYVANIGSSSEVEATIQEIEDTLGPIYYLVNAAGILRTGRITDIKDEDWEATIKVNVNGVFFVSRAVTRRMIARKDKGAVVTIASNAASTARVQMAAYAASKAAVVAFTKCLGLEMAEYGIRCNVVAPGSTDTNMLGDLNGGSDRAKASITGSPETFRLGIPLKKIAQPSHIADAVMFLLSEMAGHITMETLTIDGGATLGA